MNPIKVRILYGLISVLTVFCLALSGQIGGQVSSGSGGGSACAGACNTAAAYEEWTSGTSAFGIGAVEGNYYCGFFWTPSENKCFCRGTFCITKAAGDISGKTFVVEFWTTTGTSLNEKLGSTTGVAGNNSWSGTTQAFDFSTHQQATASTTYAVTITMNEVDASNNAKIYVDGYGTWANANAARWNSDGSIKSNLTTYDTRASIYTE